jgi:hypothetical protein
MWTDYDEVDGYGCSVLSTEMDYGTSLCAICGLFYVMEKILTTRASFLSSIEQSLPLPLLQLDGLSKTV